MNTTTIPVYQHGGVWPLGIPVSLSWAEVGAILALIHEFKVRTFLEIGVEHGGLASLLIAREDLTDDFHYFGIEIQCEKLHPKVLQNRTLCERIACVDVFSDSGVAFLDKVEGYPKPLMVFCDDGDKPREARLVSGVFSDAYILVHDYSREFMDEDQPEGTERIDHPWLIGTRLFFMKVLNPNRPAPQGKAVSQGE